MNDLFLSHPYILEQIMTIKRRKHATEFKASFGAFYFIRYSILNLALALPDAIGESLSPSVLEQHAS